jgi:hypothetical protein
MSDKTMQLVLTAIAIGFVALSLGLQVAGVAQAWPMICAFFGLAAVGFLLMKRRSSSS